MSSTLDEICAEKRREVARRKAVRDEAALEALAARASPPRGFARALHAALAAGGYGLIAELKKASPSAGVIRADFEPPALARAYADGGATCLSVLTDRPYFQGDDACLLAARTAVTLPVLRKDFIVEPYQVAESRALGADCILLILAALDDRTARDLAARARDFGMDVLVEVHDRAEIDRAVALDPALIGINNRNLRTFAVALETTERLAPLVPPGPIVVSESGLATPADLARMATAGVRCFLIGSALMREADVAAATRKLLARPPAAAD
jgi:indole-3-glycerol phosphate synthase